MSPVGLVTRKRAEYLMRAAAVAGGAVYVGLELGMHQCLEEAFGDPWGPTMFLAVGTLPNGEAVPTTELEPAMVLDALRAEVARLDKLSKFSSCLVELREQVEAVLADLEPKLKAA